MSRIAIEFAATGNFAPLIKQIQSVNAELASTSLEMNKLGAVGNAKLASMQSEFKNTLQTMGGFTATTMNVRTQTEKMTEAIKKQEISWRNLGSARKEASNIANMQSRLDQSVAANWSKSAGRTTGTLMIPDAAIGNISKMNAEMKVYTQIADSVATNTIKMGKNMQWAGRQLTVGLTLPIAGLIFESTKAAREVNAAMTELVKVYGTLNVGKAELDAVKKATMETAGEMAKQYGFMEKDTIALGAAFAQMGYQGKDLQDVIKSTSRIMVIGDIDRETALHGAVALQKGFNLSTQELADTFNHLNVVENQTILSTKDILFAMPQAGAAVKAAGGTIGDMTAMLAAMEERGFAVGRASMAIRSGMADLASPGKAAIKIFAEANMNLEEIIKKGRARDGIKGVLEDVSAAFYKLNDDQKRLAAVAIFKKQQYAPWLGLMDEVHQATTSATKDVNAYAQAQAAATMSNADAANIAAAEVHKQVTSASGEFKRLKADINKQFVDMGTPFLRVINDLMRPVLKIMTLFNHMPALLKEGFTGLLVGGALVGPLVMLSGLVANFFGQMAKGAIQFTKMILGVKELRTAEQRLEELLSGKVTPSVDNQAEAFVLLAREIRNTSEASKQFLVDQAAAARQMEITRVEGLAKNNGGVYLHEYGNSKGSRAGSAEEVVRINELNAAKEKAHAARMVELEAEDGMQKKLAEDEAIRSEMASKTTARFVGLTRAVGAAGGILTLMSGTTNGWIIGLGNAAMAISLFPGLLKPVIFLMGKLFATEMMTMFAAQIRMIAFTTLPLLRGALMAALGPIGWIAAAVTAVVVAFELLHKSAKDGQKANSENLNAAKSLAASVGAGYATATYGIYKMNGETKKAVDNAKAWGKANKDVIAGLNHLYTSAGGGVKGDDALVKRATEMGVDARKHGSTAEQAKKEVETVLRAVGRPELVWKVKLDFKDNAAVDRADAERHADELGRIVSNKFSETFGQKFKRLGYFGQLTGLNEGAKAAAKKIGEEFGVSVGEGINNPKAREEMKTSVAQLRDLVQQGFGKAAASKLNDSTKTTLQAMGINPEDKDAVAAFFTGLYTKAREGNKAAKKTLNDLTYANHELAVAYGNTTDAEKIAAQALLAQAGINNEATKGFTTMAQVQKYISDNFGTMSQASSDYQTALAQLHSEHIAVTQATMDAIAQHIKEKYHLDGVSLAAIEAADGITQLASAMNNVDPNGEFAARLQGMTDKMHTEIEKQVGEYADAGVKMFDDATAAGDKSFDRQVTNSGKYFDGLKAAQDQLAKTQVAASNRAYSIQNKQLERTYQAQVKNVNKTSNLQLAALNNQMKKEKAADAQRQALFQAEQMRLQRLSESANSSIDLNAALRSGNLDEAARVLNTQETRADVNAASDANAKQDASSQISQDKRQAKIDTITNSRDAELAAMQKVFDARKQDIADRKAAAAANIQTAREAAKAELDIRKQAAADALAADKTSYDQHRAIVKKTLEDALANWRTYGATTLKNYQDNGAGIEKVVKDIGGIELGKNKEVADKFQTGWKGATDSAIHDIQNSMEWKNFGATLSKQVAAGLSGIPGITWDQYLKYMETGVKPDVKPPSTSSSSYSGGANQVKKNQVAWNHSGGAAGNSSGRAGRPLHHGLYPDEIPTVLQAGEFVVQKKAVQNIGVDTLQEINNGKQPRFFHQGGLADMMSMLAAATIKRGVSAIMRRATLAADDRRIAAGADPASTILGGTMGIGNVTGVDGSQRSNAMQIIGMGKSMGASQRDLIVSIMTALQESGLKNLPGGDRDSVGLFQQRPSQGWGTPQQIMNPSYAAHKFFEGLLAIKDRNKMPLTQEAQAVQRSAFPDAYAKWEAQATALVQAITSPVAKGAPGQTFPELIQLIKGGPANRVTATTNGTHANGSYHYLGDAVDFAEERPSSDSPGLLAINRFWAQNFGAGLKELIYSGPGGIQMKDGKVVDGNSFYGPETMAGHHNHVHVAATPDSLKNLGISIPGLRRGGVVMNDNTLANLHARETVLTAPLSRSLEQGIQNMDNSSRAEYTINVHPSPGMDETALANKVAFMLQQKEMSKGVSRRLIGRDR